MEFEVCIDSLAGALAADKFGADRVELCSALYEGGLTPSVGLTKQVVEQSNQPVFAMIRPEAGGFTYSPEMIEVMKADIVSMAESGAKGVVFGVLHEDKEIDIEVNAELTQIAKENDLEVVFHRAFDFCPDPIKALNQLIEMGVDRLLTSGQQPKAIEGKTMIQELVKLADGKIEIMAGSGVMLDNAEQLISTGVDAIHFTAGQFEENVQLGMGAKLLLDENKIEAIMKFKK